MVVEIVLAAVAGEVLLAVGIGKLLAAGRAPAEQPAQPTQDARVIPLVRHAG